jgi:hypothetical protein
VHEDEGLGEKILDRWSKGITLSEFHRVPHFVKKLKLIFGTAE